MRDKLTVTVTGPHGSGVTTLTALIAKLLQDVGYEAEAEVRVCGSFPKEIVDVATGILKNKAGGLAFGEDGKVQPHPGVGGGRKVVVIDVVQ